VLEHKRFVFVPSAPRRRHLLTLGNALDSREYLILGTLKPDVNQLIENSHYRGKTLRAMTELRDEVANQVVVGLYRAWRGSPPYLFYAHRDYADLAAHIVIADSLLQPHRGFPLLIDLADALCRAGFGGEAFFSTIQSAYARAGETFGYLGERETRYE
jgi:hypothetical protein